MQDVSRGTNGAVEIPSSPWGHCVRCRPESVVVPRGTHAAAASLAMLFAPPGNRRRFGDRIETIGSSVCMPPSSHGRAAFEYGWLLVETFYVEHPGLAAGSSASDRNASSIATL